MKTIPDRVGHLSPQELHEMCQESTAALRDLRQQYEDIIDSLIRAHNLDITTDPDTERQARKVLEAILTLQRKPWNLDYDEQEQEESEYFMYSPYVVLTDGKAQAR